MNDISEKLKALNQKIEQAKNKRNVLKDSNTKISNISNGINVIIEMISGTIVGAGLGIILDKMFDFRFFFLIVLTIMGSFAGMLNVHHYLKDSKRSEKGEK